MRGWDCVATDSAGGLRGPGAKGLRIWKVRLGVGVTRKKTQIEESGGTRDQTPTFTVNGGVMPSADDRRKAQRVMSHRFKTAACTLVSKDRGLSRGNFLGHWWKTQVQDTGRPDKVGQGLQGWAAAFHLFVGSISLSFQKDLRCRPPPPWSPQARLLAAASRGRHQACSLSPFCQRWPHSLSASPPHQSPVTKAGQALTPADGQ